MPVLNTVVGKVTAVMLGVFIGQPATESFYLPRSFFMFVSLFVTRFAVTLFVVTLVVLNKSVSVTFSPKILDGSFLTGSLGADMRSRIWPIRPKASGASSVRAAGKLSNSARTSGHHSACVGTTMLPTASLPRISGSAQICRPLWETSPLRRRCCARVAG